MLCQFLFMMPPEATLVSMTQILQACVPCLCIERAVTICHPMLSSLLLTWSLPSLHPTHCQPTWPFFSTSFLQSCWQKKSKTKGIFKPFNLCSCLNYFLFLVLVFFCRLSHFLGFVSVATVSRECPDMVGPDKSCSTLS